MLCQNCQTKDAAVHLKQIINGEAIELHLCPDCAAAMGYSDMLGMFQLPFGRIFGAAAGKQSTAPEQRCPTCGFTFSDISHSGRPGCPDCYRFFADRLAPSIKKIHGRAVYTGKIPESAGKGAQNERRLRELKAQMDEAVRQQDFERAAFLRDEIKDIVGKETNG